MTLQRFIKNPITWIHYLAKKQGFELFILWAAYIGIMALPLLAKRSQDLVWKDIKVFYYTSVPLAHGIIWGVLVFFYGIGAIEKDINTKMLESHRLMPQNDWRIILGYVNSILTAVVPLGIVNFLVGVAVFSDGTWAMDRWLSANALLLAYIPFLCMFALFTRMICGRKIATLIVLGIFALFFWYIIFMILPVTLLIVLPWLQFIPGQRAFFENLSTEQMYYYYSIAILFVLFLTFFFFVVCLRKYRQPQQTWLSPMMALVFMGGWVFATRVSLNFWSIPEMGGPEEEVTLSMSLGLVSCFLIACLPLSSSAWHNITNLQRRLIKDPKTQYRSLPVWLCAMVSTGFIFVFLILGQESLTQRQTAYAGIIIFFGCMSLAYWIHLARSLRFSTISLVILWFLMLHGVPYSLGLQLFSPYQEMTNYWVLFPSPVAVIAYLPELSEQMARFAVLLHAALAAGVFVLYQLRMYFIKSSTEPGRALAAVTTMAYSKSI